MSAGEPAEGRPPGEDTGTSGTGSSEQSQFARVTELAGQLPAGSHVPADRLTAVVSVLAHGLDEAKKIVDASSGQEEAPAGQTAPSEAAPSAAPTAPADPSAAPSEQPTSDPAAPPTAPTAPASADPSAPTAPSEQQTTFDPAVTVPPADIPEGESRPPSSPGAGATEA